MSGAYRGTVAQSPEAVSRNPFFNGFTAYAFIC
jgi:hypothetical protein